MGMSASQARLLTITSRMNDIEFKSQQVANVKIRLADDSDKVAQKYTDALNKQKLTFKQYGNNGSVSNISLDSTTITSAGYRLRRTAGAKNKLSETEVQTRLENFKNKHPWVQQRLAETPVVVSLKQNISNSLAAPQFQVQAAASTTAQFQTQAATTTTTTTTTATAQTQTAASTTAQTQTDAPVSITQIPSGFRSYAVENGMMWSVPMDVATAFEASLATEDGIPTSYTATQLYEMIESGQFYLEKIETGEQVSVSSDVSLAISSDDATNIAKAEAEYNADSAKINRKEKQLDQEMKALDTEHNALKTEMDSIKSLISNNVEKTFNLFS